MKLLYILTYDCNYRCKYCDINKREQKISKKIISDSFLFIKKLNISISEIKFFWWEPLLEKNNIKYIIDNIPLKNVDYFITTNASLVNDNFITFSKQNDIKLTFSIDWNSKTTESNRLEIWSKWLYDIVLENTIKYSPFIRINMVITSKTAVDMVENFNYLYNKWVRNFNFLPEYFNYWSKDWLLNLINGFKEILELYSKWKIFKLINIENFQEVSFFNLGIIIDTDWKIYWTNHILAWHFEKYKEDLIIWDIWNWLKYDIFDKDFSEIYRKKLDKINNENYNKWIIKSVEYIDKVLNNFVYEFKKII